MYFVIFCYERCKPRPSAWPPTLHVCLFLSSCILISLPPYLTALPYFPSFHPLCLFLHPSHPPSLSCQSCFPFIYSLCFSSSILPILPSYLTPLSCFTFVYLPPKLLFILRFSLPCLVFLSFILSVSFPPISLLRSPCLPFLHHLSPSLSISLSFLPSSLASTPCLHVTC